MRKTELKRKTPLKRTAAEKEWAKPRRANPLKKGQPKRDWSDARAKVEAEGCCRMCSLRGNIQAAHIIGRSHDRPRREGAKTLYVHPDSIVPLCRGCHYGYDHHFIDALGYLTAKEEARAVLDAGGLELARRRLAPSQYGGRRVVSEGKAA